jgi:catechol 2,3-dioxygenase-like lactoylglutathione lyase family enzyme
MSEGIGVVGLYVHDQDEALDFYVGKLGFQVHTDAHNGNYRWLTVKHPNQPTRSSLACSYRRSPCSTRQRRIPCAKW